MENYLIHHGVIGQRWGVRRYQNEDGTRKKGLSAYYENSYNRTMQKIENKTDKKIQRGTDKVKALEQEYRKKRRALQRYKWNYAYLLNPKWRRATEDAIQKFKDQRVDTVYDTQYVNNGKKAVDHYLVEYRGVTLSERFNYTKKRNI